MEETEKYIQAIKGAPELLSMNEVAKLLEKPKQKQHVKNTWRYAATISILVTIGAFLAYILLPNPPQLDQDQLAYSSFRYANLMHKLKENPTEYTTQIVTSKALESYQAPIEITAMLSLPEDKLRQMGFQIKENEITYEINIADIGYLQFWMNNNDTGLGISERQVEDVPTYDFYPLYVSDIDGKQRLRYRLSKEDSDKMYNFYNRIDHLIPVLIQVPNGVKKIVLWFLPTQGLLDILEEDILESQDYLADFEPLKAYEGVQIMPNLSENSMSLSAGNFQTIPQVDLMDVQGNSIKSIPLESTSKQSRNAKYKFDLTGVPQGMYLVAISDKKSNTIYKRLIVTENIK